MHIVIIKPAFVYPKATTETLGQCVKYAQSFETLK